MTLAGGRSRAAVIPVKCEKHVSPHWIRVGKQDVAGSSSPEVVPFVVALARVIPVA